MHKAWPAWLMVLGLLLAIFFVLDVRNFRRAPDSLREIEREPEQWSVRGAVNVIFLIAVLVGVFLPHEWKLRFGAFGITAGAVLMFASAFISWKTTPREIHEANDFNFHPVAEVGWLFLGIFLTMIPALDLLAAGDTIKLGSPLGYYFACGSLSAFLDNAPTYLTFASLAQSIGPGSDVAVHLAGGPVSATLLTAISAGSVLMGANSYIGNGPNFMVKAIAEEQGVAMPSFGGYMLWSGSILIPIFVLVTLVFFS